MRRARARAPSAVSWRALPSSLRAPPPLPPPPPGARSAQTRLFVSAGILGEAEAAAMPGKLKVKIVAGRHLPVMDRASDLTDAFVEVGSWSCPSEHGAPSPALPAVPGSVEGCPPAPSPLDVAIRPGQVPPPGSRCPPGSERQSDHLPVRGVAAETLTRPRLRLGGEGPLLQPALQGQPQSWGATTSNPYPNTV